jgi:RNA-directed DNA polymerase
MVLSNDKTGRTTEKPALEASLLDTVLSSANMAKAWKQVKRNEGGPGIDGITIARFPAYLKPRWERIKQAVLRGYYIPKPVKRVELPKPSGGTRKLGIPVLLDRMIQQAITQVLMPIFDPAFSDASHGFRPGRSAHGAMQQVQKYVKDGYRYAVEVDIEKFFDNVNHDILMHKVARKVKDKSVLRLIGRYLRAGVHEQDGTVQSTDIGTPQGGPLSPLLSNILLDVLDKELEQRGWRFARYADDRAPRRQQFAERRNCHV